MVVELDVLLISPRKKDRVELRYREMHQFDSLRRVIHLLLALLLRTIALENPQSNAMRVLVVGAGSISREFALHHFNPSTNTVVAGIVDLDEKKASDLAIQVGSAQAGERIVNEESNKYKARALGKKGTPVPHFSSLKVALETFGDSVDIVYIGTTPKSHRSLVEESFRYGKHVLVEKPLATTIDDADAIVATSNAAGSSCILAMNIGMRYNKALQELRQRVLVEQELGEQVRAVLKMHFSQWPREWQTQPWCAGRKEGGPLREVGTHFFSALLEFSGAHDNGCQARPVRARVRASVEYPEHSSTSELLAPCETKAAGVIELEGGALPSEGLAVEFSVLTDAPQDLYQLTITPKPETSKREKKSLTLFNFVSLRNQNGQVLVRNSPYGRKECIQAIVAAASKNEGASNDLHPSIVTAQHGRNAQRILDAILESNGEYLTVEFDL